MLTLTRASADLPAAISTGCGVAFTTSIERRPAGLVDGVASRFVVSTLGRLHVAKPRIASSKFLLANRFRCLIRELELHVKSGPDELSLRDGLNRCPPGPAAILRK